jgi:hypothetical protein
MTKQIAMLKKVFSDGGLIIRSPVISKSFENKDLWFSEKLDLSYTCLFLELNIRLTEFTI